MISTIAMVRLGKTFGNLMVDVRATNDKLRDRARRIVADATGVARATSPRRPWRRPDGDVKVAIVMLLTGFDAAEAAARLGAHARRRASCRGAAMRVVGMISGTSMDGIDVAVADLRFVDDTIELRPLGAGIARRTRPTCAPPSAPRCRRRRRPPRRCAGSTRWSVRRSPMRPTFAVGELGGGDGRPHRVARPDDLPLGRRRRSGPRHAAGRSAGVDRRGHRDPRRRRPAHPRHRRAAATERRWPARSTNCCSPVRTRPPGRSTSAASPTSRSSLRRCRRSPSTSVRPTP